MKTIIVAAGRGSRMRYMTDALPKCMAVVLRGKTLLETQLETLRACGIVEIALVRGYQAEKINLSGIRYYENRDYRNNNILESLFCAEPELDGDTLFSYSDIWYEADVVKRLCESRHDIAIGVDIDWKDGYVGRNEHPINEAENVVFDSGHNVIKIGKIGAEGKDVDGEFIGMMKLTRYGCETLKQHYHKAKKLFEGKPFQRASVFKKAYLTDLLQDMADQGVAIHCEIVGHAWKEIDTVEDFKNAVERFEKKPAATERNKSYC